MILIQLLTKEEQNIVWNTNTLSEFNHLNFDSILRPNMIEGTEKYLTIDGLKIEGFTFKKKHKDEPAPRIYYVRTQDIKKLPILVDKNTCKKEYYRDKIYYLVKNITPLNINPEKIYSWRELIDYSGIPYHSSPVDWTLYKNKRLFSRLGGQQYHRIVSESSFGKDKYTESIRLLLDNMSVLSDPTTANLFFRACHNVDITINELPDDTNKTDFIKMCNMFMRIGDGTKILDNRARKTGGTYDSTDISNLSIIFTHNVAQYYHDKGRPSFEDIYPFNVLNRYFDVVYDGYLQAQIFDNINYEQTAKDYQQFIKNWIKSALWYEEHWHEQYNLYPSVSLDKYHFDNKNNRHKDIFQNFAKCLSHYAETEQEYKQLLDYEYKSYQKNKDNEFKVVKEEPVKELTEDTRQIIYNGQQVGTIDGKVYIKKCNEEHFMVKYQGFGISLDVLTELTIKGVKEIEIQYTKVDGTIERYMSNLGQWQTTPKQYDWNGDRQKFLSLKEMTKYG